VWSAGCSSGEEPYSIVILAREAGFDPERDLRVYASDISRRMMKRARAGSYRETSFRETEPALRAKYFEEKEGSWTVSVAVKKCVDFVHLNLMDRPRVALLGRSEPEVVREAVRCFGSHAEPGELEALLPLVAHADWSVRAEVVEVLAERRVRHAVPAILRRLETEQDDVVRGVTLAALQRLDH